MALRHGLEKTLKTHANRIHGKIGDRGDEALHDDASGGGPDLREVAQFVGLSWGVVEHTQESLNVLELGGETGANDVVGTGHTLDAVAREVGVRGALL